MTHDPILDEVRSIRDAIAQENDYDVGAIFAMFRQSAPTSSRAHVNLSVLNSVRVLGAAQRDAAAGEAVPRR